MDHPGNVPLRVEGVTVEFGATRALNDVDAEFAAGKIIGLVGHNGAGKSTLLNVATGAVRPTRGRMVIDGKVVPDGAGPSEIAGLGVTVVHQVPALVDSLSVLDNIFLRQEHLASRRARRRLARDALARIGRTDIGLDTRVSQLQLAEKQLVALARGFVAGDIRALLLDEPTAALGREETDVLHALIRDIAAESATVIYVSHRLPDIMEVCDEVIVVRDGEVVLRSTTAGLAVNDLARALAPDLEQQDRIETSAGEVVIEIAGPAPMTFRAGEVVGLFGVAAGSQFALVDAFQGRGDLPDVTLDGQRYAPGSPAEAIRNGVHTVCADRDKDGLVSSMGAQDNVYLPWYGRRRAFRGKNGETVGTAEHYRTVRERLNIIGPGASSPIWAFSGGNRQKHLIASWMLPVTPRVLLMAQPTQGVDVSAKADIRRAVRELANDGVCVVIASAESDEIAGLCDRSYVMVGDEVAEVAHSATFDEDLLESLLTRGNADKEYAR